MKPTFRRLFVKFSVLLRILDTKRIGASPGYRICLLCDPIGLERARGWYGGERARIRVGHEGVGLTWRSLDRPLDRSDGSDG